jgi:hypothetical protein
MRTAICACLLIWLCRVPAVCADEVPSPRPIEKADSVLAIYPENWGLFDGERVPVIILAIWSDGKIVWSSDRLNGGPPYLSGQIDPEKVASLLSDLERDGLFADNKLNVAHFGPDSHFTTLLVKSGKKQVTMQSWHERSEAGGKSIAGSRGVSGLAGQRRFQALSKEPAEYLYYRLVWSETRGKLIDLIPDVGTSVAGRPVTNDKGLAWQEAPAKVEKP